MTQTETARRLQAAEEEIRSLRAELSALRQAAAETRIMVLLAAQETPEAREILGALTATSSDYGAPRTDRPTPRPRLQLVHSADLVPQPAQVRRPRLQTARTVDSVSGQDMDEALRRVRGGEGW